MDSKGSSRPAVEAIETVAQSSWLTLQHIYFKDRRGQHRVWDRCIRTDPRFREASQDVLRPHGQTAGSASPRNTQPSPSTLLSPQLLSASTTSDGQSSTVPNGTLTTPEATAILPLLYRSSQVRCGSTLAITDYEVALVKQFRPPLCAYSIEFPAGLLDAGEDPVVGGLRELKEETGFTANRVLLQSPLLSLSPGMGTESSILLIAMVDLDAPENQSPTQTLDDDEDIEVLRVPLVAFASELKRLSEAPDIIVFDEVYCVSLGLSILPALLQQSLVGPKTEAEEGDMTPPPPTAFAHGV